VSSASIAHLDIRDLRERPGIDAVLMLSTFAHERYGGHPDVGVSKVLENTRDTGARWVVTTAPRRIHMEEINENTTIMVPDDLISEDEEAYESFLAVFRTVSRFNDSRQGRIGTLGIHLALINAPQGDARSEAEAVRTAYLEASNVVQSG
jgi:hypothetical protein